MSPNEFDKLMIPPAHEAMGIKTSPESRVMMIAICLQESNLTHRVQVLANGGRGPARGVSQFEKGGVRGVWKHHISHEPLRLLCKARDVSFDIDPIWASLEFDDVMAAGLTRLLLLTDPRPLPSVGDPVGSWAYYLRCWRPGKPHPSRWPSCHEQAVNQVLDQDPQP